MKQEGSSEDSPEWQEQWACISGWSPGDGSQHPVVSAICPCYYISFCPAHSGVLSPPGQRWGREASS